MGAQQLHAEVMLVRDIAARVTDDMFALFQTCYDDVSQTRFEEDLSRKDYAVLLNDDAGTLQGFTTVEVLSFEFQNLYRRAIFSGDTIINPDHWGQLKLSKAFIQLVDRIRLQDPAKPLYWFLIVKGHRTYRYLPAHFNHYYPNWRDATPEPLQSMMNHLAQLRFGDCYNKDLGLIRFPDARGRLNERWAAVPDKDLSKPEVKFFLDRNPRYALGEELVCLAEIEPDNLRPFIKRQFESRAHP